MLEDFKKLYTRVAKRVKKLAFTTPFFKYVGYTCLGIFLFIVLLFVYYGWNLPKPDKFSEIPFAQSTKIYDRTGKVLLYDIYGEEKREVVPFDKISSNVKDAILSSEDSRFYHHIGIDIRGTMRAILTDLKIIHSDTGSQGGSTITQQLVRSVYLTKEKTISRKIKEIILSLELETRYSKDQIFDWYLNKVPFGENSYGVEAASQTYFSKSANDLTPAEGAVLAALLPAPSYYSPYGSHKDELLKRKDVILDKMGQQGYISADQVKQAKDQTITFSEIKNSIKAPHFVFYVKKYLEDKYDPQYLQESGLKIYTSLDWDLQEYMEKTIKDNEQSLKNRGAYNAAAVAIDPKTGQILAFVGSKDYFADSYPAGCDEKADNNCLFNPKYDIVSIAERQPGSAFKPIVYATAFKKGFTPDTKLWDVKTEFNPYCSPDASQATDQYGLQCYHPQNYDLKFRGQVSLRQSLAGSLNLPSVKTLYLAGIPDSLQTAKDMGITTLTDTQNYGLSLVLGGGSVNLLEMASAYGVFATEGNYIPATSILKITDSNDKVIEENKTEPTKVLDTQVSREVTDILSDNNARTFIFGPNSPLYFPDKKVAVKTGTTQNLVDGWTMGYSQSVVIGVWVGNNNNKPTHDAGVGLAAPMWHAMMDKSLSMYPSDTFTPPDTVTNTKPVLIGQLPPGDTNTILDYVDKNNPLGPPPENPSKDPEYILWQFGINSWLSALNPVPVVPPDGEVPPPGTQPFPPPPAPGDVPPPTPLPNPNPQPTPTL